MNLQCGFPPVAQFGGTLGYTVTLTESVSNPPRVLQSGIPAKANATGTLGYTYTRLAAATYRYANTELERKRMFLTLASRSFDIELARKKLTMEVEA
jgi:hypothetical protein